MDILILLNDFLVTFNKTKAVVRRCFVKKLFLEISQNLQGNTCAGVSFLIKLQAFATLLKKRLWHRRFPVNFVKFLRTHFLTKHLWWLLLNKTSFEYCLIYFDSFSLNFWIFSSLVLEKNHPSRQLPAQNQ